MEPNDDLELRSLLREWQAPPTTPSFELHVLKGRRPWWQFLLSGHILVPVPVACCLIVLLTAAEVWRWTRPAQTVVPHIVVRTERVEVPVVRERVITKVVYENRPVLTHIPEHALTFHQLRPVAELRPRIIKGGHDQN